MKILSSAYFANENQTVDEYSMLIYSAGRLAVGRG